MKTFSVRFCFLVQKELIDKPTGLVLISFSFVYFLLMFVYIVGVLIRYQVLYIHYINFSVSKYCSLFFSDKLRLKKTNTVNRW